MIRSAALQEKWVKGLPHLGGPHLGTNRHRQRLTGIFIENGQHLVWPSVTQLVVYEVY